MTRYVALFRGINVGKAKRIAMADLRALLESLGYADVQTLLNSGNAVFSGPAGAAAGHARRIRAAVLESSGVDAMVIVKTAKDLHAIVAENEIAAEGKEPSKLFVVFTMDAKALASLVELGKRDWGREELVVGKHAAYVWCADGILQSKLGVALLRDLGDVGTTRNWGTTLKLDAMLTP
jgi:uncharacterized protein (DUF1697 family)